MNDTYTMTTSCQGLRIAIVGGGLGGLAAAIAIRRGNHAVTILEQAKSLEEVSNRRRIEYY